MSMNASTADAVVIGGGAAGMMTAVTAAGRGLRVVLLEPQRRCGRKLGITGKGRCNVTNNSSCPEFLSHITGGGRFLRPSLYRFPPEAAMAFFEELGVPLKTERGGRVFPCSDRAGDIVEALERAMAERGVQLLRRRALSVESEGGRVSAVLTAEGRIPCAAAVLCTGGLSYPATGSTGDGYAMARALGHHVTALRPSLVPLEAGPDCEELQGLSLRNVTLRVRRGERLVFEELGELLFTHFGVSGPLVLSASTVLRDGEPCSLSIDLKPGLTPEKLDERLLRDFSQEQNRSFRNSLDALLPRKLIPVIVRRSGIDPEKKIHDLTRRERLSLGALIKNFTLRVLGTRPVAEAIVTAGGVELGEVNPRTMESRLLPGLYFAGEILDLDGCTGGYNLQIAWSTAVCAGNAVEGAFHEE